ncbi:DoxX family protein [Aquimarina sediminis]|uniref:DoxX family protein n=1 Tax=Aquimarina sediminis TaxID=2070536 RepID=UPI000CA00706|nr:DoxX family protein [Aquimarina sediminis]
MSKTKILYWAATLLVAIPMLGNGILEILQFEEFLAEATKLGYPLYFFTWLGIAKIIGITLLVAPLIPNKLKELAYAGFFFDFLFAFISLAHLDDFLKAFVPLVFMSLLAVSYIYYTKLNKQ